MLKYFIIIPIFYFSLSYNTIAKRADFSRTVIALWDSSTVLKHEDYTFSLLHQKLEMVANHLGLKFIYFDIRGGIPKKLLTTKQKYFAIITWFSDSIKNSAEVYKWLTTQLLIHKKIVMLGTTGISYNKNNTIQKKIYQRFFKRFGMKTSAIIYDNTFFNKISYINKKMFNYERTLKGEIGNYYQTHSTNKYNQIQLSLIANNNSSSLSNIVWTGPNGGYAQQGFILFTNPKNGYSQWKLNPFLFLKKALSLDIFPIPDITTINGKRILYNHIDGDGFNNISYIDNKSKSSEIVYEKILTHYKIPTSVSLIVAEMEPKYYGKKDSISIAKKIMKLKYIEPASHTFTHPLSWNQVPSKNEFYIYRDKAEKYSPKAIVAYPITGVLLDYQLEIKKSIEYINTSILSKQKKSNIIFWSGSCLPTVQAMSIVYKNKFLNLNGGDGRYDKRFPSITNLSSLYREVGPYTQVYTSFANENIFTNLWLGPFDGQKELVDSFIKTEYPIRLRPMNIYYHFYSGEHKSSIQALQKVYDYAIKQEPFYIYASEYTKLVNSFINVKIIKKNKNTFIIRDNGSLRTFRIDKEGLYPNYKRSKNIIGHHFINHSLYLFLGKKKSSTIYLSKKEPSLPYIKESNCYIDYINRSNKFIDIYTKCSKVIRSTITIANLEKKRNYIINKRAYNSGDLGEIYFVIDKQNLNAKIRLNK